LVFGPPAGWLAVAWLQLAPRWLAGSWFVASGHRPAGAWFCGRPASWGLVCGWPAGQLGLGLWPAGWLAGCEIAGRTKLAIYF
jgi:hypothetical protein